MQVNVLGAERRRRWRYDEKVRLVEETLQSMSLYAKRIDRGKLISYGLCQLF
jgi:transposase-like protein